MVKWPFLLEKRSRFTTLSNQNTLLSPVNCIKKVPSFRHTVLKWIHHMLLYADLLLLCYINFLSFMFFFFEPFALHYGSQT